MAVYPIPPTSSTVPSIAAPKPGVIEQVSFGPEQPESPFAELVQGMLGKANAPHLDADAALQKLISGETDNVHNVVLSVVKADMSFRFLLELRNRLTESYQEVMRMQV